MSDVSIKVNNKIMKVQENVPLGVALHKAGITYYESSFKFNRPRGSLSFEWWSPERIYVEGYGPVNHYLMKTKNGLSIKIEKKRLQKLFMEVMSPYLKVGFQHNRFFRNKVSWSVTWKLMKHFLPNPRMPERIKDIKNLNPIIIETDVIVIGSGIGGLSAALSARSLGAKVVILEGDNILGGHLGYDHAIIEKLNKTGSEIIQDLLQEAERSKINIIKGTALTAILDDAWIGIQFDEPSGTPVLVKSKSIVIASGAREILTIFGNNDLPGIILGSSALKLLNVYKTSIGRNISVIGSNNWAARIALQFSMQGLNTTLISTTDNISEFYKKQITSSGVRYIKGYRVLEAVGTKHVTGIRITNSKDTFNIDADAVILASMRSPAIELPSQMGVPLGFHIKLGGFVPIHGWSGETIIHNVFIAGELGGVIDEPALIPFSKAAGLNAAFVSGIKVSEKYLETFIDEGKHMLSPEHYSALEELVKSFEHNEILSVNGSDTDVLQNTLHKRSFLCPCIDITTDDVKNVIKKFGWFDMEKIKRYSGLGTGKCQGKYCSLASTLYISTISNVNPIQVGMFKLRPPTTPIPLSVIGGFEQ
ncbi:MAG: FAD-dependent oxidoreductase [Thermoprotei archaeon]